MSVDLDKKKYYYLPPIIIAAYDRKIGVAAAHRYFPKW